MDEKLKTKWVKALRSGKYEQTDEYLRHKVAYDGSGNRLPEETVAYCCLGVLCEVAPGIKWDDEHRGYVITNKELVKLFNDYEGPAYDEHYGTWEFPYDSENHQENRKKVVLTGESLPAPLAKHWGMSKRAQFQKEPTVVHCKLTRMNDGGSNFLQIADYIEKAL